MFRETLHERALELAMVRWRSRMRRFFFFELPGSVLLFALALQLHGVVHHAPALLTVGLRILDLAALSLIGYVWLFRMPPERPSQNDATVLSIVDSLALARGCSNLPPSGPGRVTME
jgi:hypothetical protein